MNIIEQIKVNDTSIDGYQGTYYSNNIEYVQITADAEGKILEGIKTDGSKHITGDLFVDGSIYNDSLNVEQIVEEIQERVDEILDDAEDTLSYFESSDNPEWMQVTTDSSGRILGGRDKDGKLKEYISLEASQIISVKSINDVVEVNDRLNLSENAKNHLKQDIGIDTVSLIEMYAYADGESDDDDTHFYGWKDNLCSIQRAINSANGTTKTIIHFIGNLDVTSPNQFFRAQNGLYAVVFIPSDKSNIEIIGEGPDKTSINVNLPDDFTNYYQYEPLEIWGNNCAAKSFAIYARNVRYCIHHDASANRYANNHTISYVNLLLRHYRNHQGAYHSCFGFGISSGMTVILERCTIIQDDSATPGLMIHDNRNFENAFVWKIKDCKIQHLNGGGTPILMTLGLGSNVDGIIEIDNLDIGSILPFIYCDNNENNSVIRVIGKNFKTPIGYITRATSGRALRITSKTIGNISSVRIDENSSAFDIIIKGNLKTDYTDDNGIIHINGYQYRDGVQMLSGYAMGELSLDPGGSISIQKRLGDCSVNNKELIVSIDGINYTILFNQDYTNYSDSSIMDVFNNVIGTVADVVLYNCGADYFPEINLENKRNASNDVIEKGMGVSVNYDGTISKATSDENLFGITLDDIIPGFYGRVVTKAVLSIDKSNPHYIYHKPITPIGDDNHPNLGIGDTAGVFESKVSGILKNKGNSNYRILNN